MTRAESVMPRTLQAGAASTAGATARLECFMGALAIGDLIKSTLGPSGMDKILQSASDGSVSVTNDGATILKKLWIDNPAAKILTNLAIRQDARFGDGTTSVVVLACELLRCSEKLLELRLHPQLVAQGLRACERVALAALEEAAIGAEGYEGDAAANEYSDPRDRLLFNLARTTLSSKILAGERAAFARIAVEAVRRAGSHTDPLSLINVLKVPGGRLSDSYIEEGYLLDKEIGTGHGKKVAPEGSRLKVLVANAHMDSSKLKLTGVQAKGSTFEGIASVSAAERAASEARVASVVATGADVFVNRQLVYDFEMSLLRKAGVVCIEHADFAHTQRLALATDASVASLFEGAILGSCRAVESKQIGDARFTHVRGCARAGACSIVVRGSSSHVLEEAERSLHDALSILTQTRNKGRFIAGGGAPEFHIAAKLDAAAQRWGAGLPLEDTKEPVSDAMAQYYGKLALIATQYRQAILGVPETLCANAGLDATRIHTAARRAAAQPQPWQYGIDIETGTVANLANKNVIESYESKKGQIQSATEAAEMILRVDHIVTMPPRQRTGM